LTAATYRASARRTVPVAGDDGDRRRIVLESQLGGMMRGTDRGRFGSS